MKANSTIKNKSPIGAYIGFLFQTFLKRPFGYIISVLFIVYLTVILLIVPSALNLGPLFIWNFGGFNIPIFNLFFIAAFSASIAVAVFRTGRDDGSDLNLSSKPFTKNAIVLTKTLVYILIMLIINVIIVLIVSLVLPVFGVYNEATNINGIELEKYFGLLISLFVGNLVNMLFFGSISVLISMVGGQVITIIGTVAIVFVMNIMNFLYPRILSKPIDVLSDRYDTSILSYNCNTLNQYNNPDESQEPFKFATIQCVANDGVEEFHYDTKEYWDKATRESGVSASNYIDIGKQLSQLYTGFGLQSAKLEEASKLFIGANSSFNYWIDEKTNVSSEDNIIKGNYPIFYYDMSESLGKYFPHEVLIGGSMEISAQNWYVLSAIFGIPFNSINYPSSSFDSITQPSGWKTQGFSKNSAKTIKDVKIDEVDKLISIKSLNSALSEYLSKIETSSNYDKSDFPFVCRDAIIAAIDSSEKFASNKFETWTDQQKYDYIAKIHTNWTVLIQQKQVSDIKEYIKDADNFPFTSATVTNYFKDNTTGPNQKLFKKQIEFYRYVYKLGINVIGSKEESDDEEKLPIYSKMVNASMEYAETLKNMYVYNVTSFYSVASVIAVWTIVATIMFAGSVIVYKKTDFK